MGLGEDSRQFSVSYNGGGRRRVEERRSTAGGGGGGPQRDAAAVGSGESTEQQRRHADWPRRRDVSSSDRSDLMGTGADGPAGFFFPTLVSGVRFDGGFTDGRSQDHTWELEEHFGHPATCISYSVEQF